MEVDDLELINLVKVHRIIYDKAHNYYADSTKRDQIWQHISNELDSTVPVCKNRWNSLRSAYANVLKKRIISREPPKKLWRLSDSFSFMDPHLLVTRKYKKGSKYNQLGYSLQQRKGGWNGKTLENHEKRQRGRPRRQVLPLETYTSQQETDVEFTNISLPDEVDTKISQLPEVSTDIVQPHVMEKVAPQPQPRVLLEKMTIPEAMPQLQKEAPTNIPNPVIVMPQIRHETDAVARRQVVHNPLRYLSGEGEQRDLQLIIDATDRFFLCMSEMTKQLAPFRQAKVKAALFHAINMSETDELQQEMQIQNRTENEICLPTPPESMKIEEVFDSF